MAANIFGRMIHSYQEEPWHKIAPAVQEEMSAEEVIDSPNFGGGFEISVRPLTVMLNGQPVEWGGQAIVRGASVYDQQEIVFGTCTKHFHPMQPREIARSFDENVGVNVETLGFLGNGEQMFVTWKLPNFEVVSGDEVKMFGMVTLGFDTLKGVGLYVTPVRVVCSNTLSMAVSWADKNTRQEEGKGKLWNGKQTNPNLIDHLGYWLQHVQRNAVRHSQMIQGLFGKLANVPVKNDAEAIEIIDTAYPLLQDTSGLFPRQLQEAKREEVTARNESVQETREGIFKLFSGAGTVITPTYWGMLNATTEYFCHYQPSKRPVAESIMVGNRQKAMNQMVDVLKSRI